MAKRVAILTGEGDVPGFNMCLKSLVYRLIDLEYEPVGVRKGWEGLIRYNPLDPANYGDNFIELTKDLVRPIDRSPGSFLHSSFIDPCNLPQQLVPEHLRKDGQEIQDLTAHIQQVVYQLGCQALVVIGGEGTLQFAAHLSRQGLPVVAIPKTIHNNFAFTAAQLVHQGVFGRMAAFVQHRMWTHVDLQLVTQGVKQVDIGAWYEPEQYRPKINLIWLVENL